MPIYNYILMSQKDFFENQVMEEILRERATYYISNDRKKDFWILIQPHFLKSASLQEKIKKSNFYRQQEKNLKDSVHETEFFISLVSMNKEFIKWVELRLGFFENLENESSFKKTSFKSNGLVGKINSSYIPCSVLDHSSKVLHPDIVTKKARIAFFNGMDPLDKKRF